MKTIKITDTVSSLYFELLQDEMTKLEGFEYSTVRGVIEDISGPQSSIFITSKFGRRPISITGIKKSQSWAERTAMLGVFKQDGRMRLLEFTTFDDLDLQAEVLVSNLIYPYNAVKKPFLIELIAPDSRFYDQVATVANSDSMSQTLDNEGNEVTDPVFKIYGPLSSVTITNTANSKTFEITYALADGDYIEVDTFNRTVKLNGSTSVFSAFDGEFIDLIPGDNDISFIPVDDGGNTNLITTFRSAYSGI